MGLRIIGIFVLAVSVILGVFVKATTGTGYSDMFTPVNGSAYMSVLIIVSLMGVILIGCGCIIEAIDRNMSQLRRVLNPDEEDKYLDDLARQNDVMNGSKSDKTSHKKSR